MLKTVRYSLSQFRVCRSPVLYNEKIWKNQRKSTINYWNLGCSPAHDFISNRLVFPFFIYNQAQRSTKLFGRHVCATVCNLSGTWLHFFFSLTYTYINNPRSIYMYKNSNMTMRLSGHFTYLVWFSLRSSLFWEFRDNGMKKKKKTCNFDLKASEPC